jgi:hypothetical protein
VAGGAEVNNLTPPLNVTQLNARLTEVARGVGIPVSRARVLLCALIVSQMLPDAVAVKGGMGLKLRFGERGTRATSDLDVFTRTRGEAFEKAFQARLFQGWGTVPPSRGQQSRDPRAPARVAFRATLRAMKVYNPGLARPESVMHPYRVSLSFLGKAWGSVEVEVSDLDIEADAHGREDIDGEVMSFAAEFGFGTLHRVNLVDVEYQIAQKIHAVTDPRYQRAHDLVDLQVLWMAGPNLTALHDLCVAIFDRRAEQVWPPLPLRSMSGWNLAYADARQETEAAGERLVLPNVEEARAWLAHVIEHVMERSSLDNGMV